MVHGNGKPDPRTNPAYDRTTSKKHTWLWGTTQDHAFEQYQSQTLKAYNTCSVWLCGWLEDFCRYLIIRTRCPLASQYAFHSFLFCLATHHAKFNDQWAQGVWVLCLFKPTEPPLTGRYRWATEASMAICASFRLALLTGYLLCISVCRVHGWLNNQSKWGEVGSEALEGVGYPSVLIRAMGPVACGLFQSQISSPVHTLTSPCKNRCLLLDLCVRAFRLWHWSGCECDRPPVSVRLLH